jgi:hypothetical protein
MFSITASGCRGSAPEAASPEPPAPLMEPELAPGSRLIDPRAEELVRQMSERLARIRRNRCRGGSGCGRVATAASSVKAAVIAAQSPQAFTLAVPLQVEIMTNVAIRSGD